MSWWHYTLGATLLGIVAEERIKRAKPAVRRGERGAVWFSSRPTWEPSATKGITFRRPGSDRVESRFATIDEMVTSAGALLRIEVSETVARHTWASHRLHGGVDLRDADALESVAREMGADPAEWRLSYHDVPLSAFLSVEGSVDGQAWARVGSYLPGGLDLADEFYERIMASPMATGPEGPDAAGSGND